MKKWLFLTLVCTMCIIAWAGLADELYQVQYDVEYQYDIARGMLSTVNAHRTADDAWIWNADNETKTMISGLAPLQYSSELEKVAMQRAAELAIYYSHTRPDGSSCFTLFPGFTMAENIAAGQPTAAIVFEDWWEENEPYAGQGHRRAILDKAYTSIGIGCVKVGGRYFWAQAFTGGGNYETVTSNPSSITVSVRENALKNAANWNIGANSMEMEVGDTASLPSSVSAVGGLFGATRFRLLNPRWKTDSALITIDGNVVEAKAEGIALIRLFANSGPEIKLTIQPGGADEPPETPNTPRYDFSDVKYDGHAVMGKLTHTEGTGEAKTLSVRITFFITGNYYMATVGETAEDGSFTVEGVGPIEYISIRAFDQAAGENAPSCGATEILVN